MGEGHQGVGSRKDDMALTNLVKSPAFEMRRQDCHVRRTGSAVGVKLDFAPMVLDRRSSRRENVNGGPECQPLVDRAAPRSCTPKVKRCPARTLRP